MCNLINSHFFLLIFTGNNKTMSKPKGIVMKAIPYIGLSSLAVMAVMAVTVALWFNRGKNGNGDIFQ